MSFLQDLLGAEPAVRKAEPKASAPKQAPAATRTPIVERKAKATLDVSPSEEPVPGHQRSHPNYHHHKALSDVLKRTNPRVYEKMLNWD